MLSRSIRRHAPRRALLAAAISLAFVFAAEAAPNAHDFDVAAGPLVDVVRALGAASGAAIEVDARDAEAMATVNGVHGEYDVDTALAAALDGSEYEAVPSKGGYQVRKRREQRMKGVVVTAPEPGYLEGVTSVGTKTNTPIRDVPQSLTVVPETVIRDVAASSLADIVRYLPGIGVAQGEGNRDTPVFRGVSSTSDFYVDGIRDDVQYIRDLYNVERVEALNGPNAMIFGRGGSGGVINRATKQADFGERREVTLQAGSYSDLRGVVDFDSPVNDTMAFRVTAMAEGADSYRDDVDLERWGINPTMAFHLNETTDLTIGYEHFSDERTADRGQPSYQGRPFDADESTFFGDPELSNVDAEVDAFNVLVEHDFQNGALLRNRTRYATYDKFYQNVFPNAAVNAAGNSVSIGAYNNATQRDNLFNQTDFITTIETGSVSHELLIGGELGRQDTSNLRTTGFFGPNGATSEAVPVTNPRPVGPIVFRPSATDANNDGVANLAAVYIQDQVELTPHWLAVVGARWDRFDVDFTNNRTGADFSVTDTPLSPRLGVIWKPVEAVSVYASYSDTFVPRAGEQLASLSLTNESLDPEEFENVEIGAKWEVSDGFLASIAVYRLDRSNVAIPDPVDVTRTLLVDGQRSEGVELGFGGQVTDRWQVFGGYAYQDGELTATASATARDGARLAQLPRHSASVWNRFDFNDAWGFGLGAIYRDEIFGATDNLVTVPSFTRFDGAVYWTASDRIRLQLNVENLFDEEYIAAANGNNNLLPGSPRAAKLAMTLTF